MLVSVVNPLRRSLIALRGLPLRTLVTSSDAPLSKDEMLAKLRAGIAPATGQRLTEISAEIFGHVLNRAGPGHRSGRKILERTLRGEMYMEWYPEPAAKNPYNPFKLTQIQQQRKEKLKLLKISGRNPPKKGAGKRAKK